MEDGKDVKSDKKRKIEENHKSEKDGGPVVEGVNLQAALRTWQNVDYSSLKKELVHLKQMCAYEYQFDGNLQHVLDLINTHVVKCGCHDCISQAGPSGGYANHHFDDEPGREFGPRWSNPWRAELIRMHQLIVPDKKDKCRLFQFIQTECKRCGVPVPDDNKDDPSRSVGSFGSPITHCLGVIEYNQRKGSWADRVRKLTYPTQIKTLYKMMHEWELRIAAIDPDFHNSATMLKPSPIFYDWFVGPRGAKLSL